MLKTKKQKTENECQTIAASSPTPTTAAVTVNAVKLETGKISQSPSTKKRQNSKSPATVVSTSQAETPLTPQRVSDYKTNYVIAIEINIVAVE